MKISIITNDGPKQYNVGDVLNHIKKHETKYSLKSIGWNKKTQIDFLTGKLAFLSVIIEKPLTLKQATNSVNQYSK